MKKITTSLPRTPTFVPLESKEAAVQKIRQQFASSYEKIADAKTYDQQKKDAKIFLTHWNNWLAELRLTLDYEAQIGCLSEEEVRCYFEINLNFASVENIHSDVMLSDVGTRIFGDEKVWKKLTLQGVKERFGQEEILYVPEWATFILAGAAVFGDKSAQDFLTDHVFYCSYSSLYCCQPQKLFSPAIESTLSFKNFEFLNRQELQNIASSDILQPVAEGAFSALCGKESLENPCYTWSLIAYASPFKGIQSQAFAKLQSVFSKKFYSNDETFVYVAMMARDKQHFLTRLALELLGNLNIQYPNNIEVKKALAWAKAFEDHKPIKSLPEDFKKLKEATRFISKNGDRESYREEGWGSVLKCYDLLTCADQKIRQQVRGLFCAYSLRGDDDLSLFSMEVMYRLRYIENTAVIPPVIKNVLSAYFILPLTKIIYHYAMIDLPTKNISDIDYFKAWVGIGRQKIT